MGTAMVIFENAYPHSAPSARSLAASENPSSAKTLPPARGDGRVLRRLRLADRFGGRGGAARHSRLCCGLCRVLLFIADLMIP
jgi:hypothetical protein